MRSTGTRGDGGMRGRCLQLGGSDEAGPVPGVCVGQSFIVASPSVAALSAML